MKAKQGMFGDPHNPPLNAIMLYSVRISSTEELESTRKKFQGVCDGSAQGGKVAVSFSTYAPTLQQIDYWIKVYMAGGCGTLMLLMVLWRP